MVFLAFSLIIVSCRSQEWKSVKTERSRSGLYGFHIETLKSKQALSPDHVRVVVDSAESRNRAVVFWLIGIPKLIRACWIHEHLLGIVWDPTRERDGDEGNLIKLQEGGALGDVRIGYWRQNDAPNICPP